MADKGVRIGITASDQTKAGVDSAKQSVEGLNAKMKGLSQGMEGVNKLASTMMGAGALAGVTMALRKVYQGAAECEAAFVKLNPEMANASGSAANFGKSVEGLKAAIGALMSGPMNYVRQAFQEVWIDPLAIIINHFKGLPQVASEAAEGVRKALSGMDVIGFTGLSAAAMQNTLANKQKLLSAMQPQGWMQQPQTTEGLSMMAQLTAEIESLKRLIPEAQKIADAKTALSSGAASGAKPEATGYFPPGYDIGTDFDIFKYALPDAIKEGLITGFTDAFPNTPGNDWGRGGRESRANSEKAGSLPFMDFLNSLADRFSGLIGSLATVQAILDPFGVILNSIVAVLQPTIDALLIPLIGALSIIGQTLGKILLPLLDFLGPIVALLVDVFVAAYNFLLPVFNKMIEGFVGIANGLNVVLLRPIYTVAAAFDWLVKTVEDTAFNLINAVAIAIGKVKTQSTAGDLGATIAGIWTAKVIDFKKYLLTGITPGGVTDAGTQYMSGAGAVTGSTGTTGGYSAGGSATYQARQISIVVNAEGAFISDLRDFALLIRNEITSAEALGY